MVLTAEALLFVGVNWDKTGEGNVSEKFAPVAEKPCIFRHPNVIILTTSNITGAIDLAFVDRADIKQYVGLPSAAAVYRIYHSCLKELMEVRESKNARRFSDCRTLLLCQHLNCIQTCFRQCGKMFVFRKK